MRNMFLPLIFLCFLSVFIPSQAKALPLTGPIFSTPPISNGSEGAFYPMSDTDLAYFGAYDHQFTWVTVPLGVTVFDPNSMDPPPSGPIYMAATGNILINGAINIGGTDYGVNPPIGGGFPFTLSTPGTITINGSLVDLSFLNLSAGTINISSSAMLNGSSLSPCHITGVGGDVTLGNYKTPTSSSSCGGLTILAGNISSGSSGVISATPEPSTLALFGTGILLMGVMAYRRKKVAA